MIGMIEEYKKRLFKTEKSFDKSDRRGSNPRPQPWQGCTLPAEPLSHVLFVFLTTKLIIRYDMRKVKHIFKKIFKLFLEKKKDFSKSEKSFLRATDGVRTRDPNLGKVVLYQLSHCRISYLCSSEQYLIYYGGKKKSSKNFKNIYIAF